MTSVERRANFFGCISRTEFEIELNVKMPAYHDVLTHCLLHCYTNVAAADFKIYWQQRATIQTSVSSVIRLSTVWSAGETPLTVCYSYFFTHVCRGMMSLFVGAETLPPAVLFSNWLSGREAWRTAAACAYRKRHAWHVMTAVTSLPGTWRNTSNCSIPILNSNATCSYSRDVVQTRQ